MKENYGKEALQLAQDVYYKFRQEKSFDKETLSIFKYALNLQTTQTITLPSFIGQANSNLHLEVDYFVPSEVTGKIVTLLNDKKVYSCNLSKKISLDLIMANVNTISFDITASSPTVATDISVTITGQIKKPTILRDTIIIDNFGMNIYQPMPNKKHYLYTLSTVNDYPLSATECEFNDYCYKYNGSLAKEERVEVFTNPLSILDKSTNQTTQSDVGLVDCASVAPLFNENSKYIVYYVKNNKLYYAKVGESFSPSVEIPIYCKSEIKKIVSLKSVTGETTHLPHFCFIDKKDDAYFVACNLDGSYSNPQKLAKAEGLSVCQVNSQVIVFLSYQDTVVKIVGSVSEEPNYKTFIVSNKSKMINVDSVAVSASGSIFYKSRNSIYEE